jgi:hypothetical protein
VIELASEFLAGAWLVALVVLIPEAAPAKPWQRILHNQRGIILDRAIRRGTSNVVLCRLRYRLATLSAVSSSRSNDGVPAIRGDA